ncbi:hypothetical protein SKAU_G00170340 [Synaphobranchus kaupii]|uniref:Uncharacterized protein n=1 Tax=Synaphobranchus kaupii TaxID=118154 RepID=A0A9Q1IYI3_SYNKA|nr:hypothetical protein SKAU_G00170340 [Synaphobranchus kaupii]
MHPCMHARPHTRTHTHKCVCTETHTQTYTCAHVHICTHMHRPTHTHTGLSSCPVTPGDPTPIMAEAVNSTAQGGCCPVCLFISVFLFLFVFCLLILTYWILLEYLDYFVFVSFVLSGLRISLVTPEAPPPQGISTLSLLTSDMAFAL